LERNLDAVIQAKNVAEQEKHAAEQERDAAIQERNAATQEKEVAIRERDIVIQERDAAIREKDAAIKELLHLRQEIDRLEQQHNDVLELCDQRDIENKRILDYDAEVDRRRRAEIDELRGQLANSELDITNLRQDLEHAEEQAGILREDKSILSEDNLALMENISGLAAELELAERRRLTAEQIALSTLSLNVSLMVKQRVLASLILVVHGVADHRIRAVGTSLAQRTAQAEQHRHERDRAAMEVVELQGRLDDAQRVNRKCLGRLREHKRRSENLQALLDSVLDRLEGGSAAWLPSAPVGGGGEQSSIALISGERAFASQGTTLRSGASRSSQPRGQEPPGRGAGKQPILWRKPSARHEL
jgi:chromosome segregation ATPase